MLAQTWSLTSRRARFVLCSLVFVSFLSAALWLDFLPGASHFRSAATHQLGRLVGTSPPSDNQAQDAKTGDTNPDVASLPNVQSEGRNKIIITGIQHDDDVSWIQQNLLDWDHAIYSVDDPHAPLHTTANKGNEANPYLNYIIHHYDNLPEIMVFLHPHKEGFWHEEHMNNLEAVQRLDLNYVRRENYVSLRCTHEPGCPAEITPPYDDPEREQQYTFAQYWPRMFPETPDMPEAVGAPCCSQFAVTRDAVRNRSRADYERFLDIISYSNVDNYFLGRIFEYTWHIIFGKEPVLCSADEGQCLKDTYNFVLPEPEPESEQDVQADPALGELLAEVERMKEELANNPPQPGSEGEDNHPDFEDWLPGKAGG